jgi:hypothetical protein
LVRISVILPSDRETEELNNPKPAKKPSPWSWKEKAFKQNTNLMQCAGIPGKINVRGLQVSSEGLTTLLARYNLVNARFCHKECCGMFEPESPEMKSCTNCISASHAIRKDQIPFLFTEPSTVEDIVQSHAMIQNAIQNAAMMYHEIDAFADSLEAKKFATYLWVHGRPSIDFEHNSNSYIMSHCGECHCCIIRSHKTRTPAKSKCNHDELSRVICKACKKEDRNLNCRQNNYKVEHGHASNSTNLDSLLKLPDHSRIKARFGDRKRQGKSKDQRIK